MLDWAYVALGRPAEAVYSERAIAIYEELGNLDLLAWVLNNLGGYRYLDGKWDEAIELAARARDTFRKIGDDTNALIVALNIAEVLSDQGRSDEAGPVFYESIDARRAVGIPLEIAEALSLLGRHEARVGKFTNAHACLDEARSLYKEHGDEFGHLATDADSWNASLSRAWGRRSSRRRPKHSSAPGGKAPRCSLPRFIASAGSGSPRRAT